MAIKIQEAFEIGAPVDRVWEFISDPTKVVTCLPGAELTQVIDAATYEGKVKVKVGPIIASYKGIARIEKRDVTAHKIRVTAEGKEAVGTGLARASMVGTVEAIANGATRVTVNADVDIKGKLAQFGGGLIQEVARQIFKQFADNVQNALSAPAEPEAPVSRQAVLSRPRVPTDAPIRPAPTGLIAHTEPNQTPLNSNINALPLIFKSIGAIFLRLFGRLFGSVR